MEVCTNNVIGNVDIIENWVQLDVVVQAYNPVFQKSKQKGTEFWTSHRCKARSRENIKPELWGNISSLLLTAEFSWHMLAKITFSYHRTKKQVYSIPKGIHFHCLNNNTKWPLGFHGNTLKVKRYFYLRCVQVHFFLKKDFSCFELSYLDLFLQQVGLFCLLHTVRVWFGMAAGWVAMAPGSFQLLDIVTYHSTVCWERKCHTLTFSAPAKPGKQLAPAWGATNYQLFPLAVVHPALGESLEAQNP